MNIRNIHKLRILAALLLSVVVCSCSQDELGIGHGDTLPPGKYPLMFTATVDGMMSRAAESELWVDGDEIAVQIDDYPVIGLYKLNEDGSVKKCDDPLSWPYEEGCVKAWYPSAELPITKQITDQSKGYHDIDILYAATETERYTNTIDLRFKHQMAKVRCKLIKGDGVTDEDLKTAQVFYKGFPEAKFSKDGLSVLGDNDWITPSSDFSVLLVPQDMSGKELIKINLTVKVNGVGIEKEMTYTPSEANLEAGKAYTYNITVQKDRLEVQTISAEWTESKDSTEPVADKYHINLPEGISYLEDLEFSSNVTPIYADSRAGTVDSLIVWGNSFTISYKPTLNNCHLGPVFAQNNNLNTVNRTLYKEDLNSADGSYKPCYLFTYALGSPISEPVDLIFDEHVEAGDIYFDDGTWGRIPKTYYEGKKTPVGMVFKAGAGSDDIPGDYAREENGSLVEPLSVIHGYVLALKDVSTGKIQWCVSTKRGTRFDTDTNNKYSGYNSNIILSKISDYSSSNFPAFWMAMNYMPANIPPDGPAAPAKSSGWYLPSHKQLEEIYSFLRHSKHRECLKDAEGEPLIANYNETGGPYWACTESAPGSAWYLTFELGDRDKNQSKAKHSTSYVRSILTF